MGSLKLHIENMLSLYDDIISLEDIKEYYAKTFYVELKSKQLEIIKEYICTRYKKFNYNITHKSFETNDINGNYLFVSDNKYFNSIEEIMRKIFAFTKVPIRRGYFKVSTDPDCYAWFPQFDNGEWENLLLDNGKTWTEKPLSKNKIDNFNNELTYEFRYIFAHEKEGYRFTGLFQETSVANNTRIYTLVDDKVLIEKTESIDKRVNTKEVAEYVEMLISNAIKEGKKSLRVSFRTIAEHFGKRVKDRAPVVCGAIRKNMIPEDSVIYKSPKGNSSLFEVEFNLEYRT